MAILSTLTGGILSITARCIIMIITRTTEVMAIIPMVAMGTILMADSMADIMADTMAAFMADSGCRTDPFHSTRVPVVTTHTTRP